jgi:hypothetical protein
VGGSVAGGSVIYYKYDTNYPHMHSCSRGDESDAKFVPAKQAEFLESLLNIAIDLFVDEKLIAHATNLRCELNKLEDNDALRA